VTDPREPFETDSAVEGIDLDDARFDVRGTVDVETGAGETGAAEGSVDTADQDALTGVADGCPAWRAASPTPWRPTRSPPRPTPPTSTGRRPGRGRRGGRPRPRRCARCCAGQFGDWYVIHSYAGYENKVKTNLESRIQSLDMEDYIFQIEVPTEEVTEIKNGKRTQVNRKKLPATCWSGWTSTTSPGARSATPRASPASSGARPGPRR
jgi:transcriptional antiterminator NusG